MRLIGTVAAAMLLLAVALPAQQQSLISGDYIEDRSNRVYGCYCEWSGERITSGREAMVAWGFKSGEYQGVELAGLKVAAVILGEGPLSFGSAPRKSILFVDQSASKPQQKAGESLIRDKYGALLGRVLGVHSMPVEFHREAGRATLRVADMVNLEMRKARPAEDAMQGAILWYDPFIPLTESTLATTLNTRYSGKDFDLKWDWSDPGINGYFGAFAMSP